MVLAMVLVSDSTHERIPSEPRFVNNHGGSGQKDIAGVLFGFPSSERPKQNHFGRNKNETGTLLWWPGSFVAPGYDLPFSSTPTITYPHRGFRNQKDEHDDEMEERVKDATGSHDVKNVCVGGCLVQNA